MSHSLKRIFCQSESPTGPTACSGGTAIGSSKCLHCSTVKNLESLVQATTNLFDRLPPGSLVQAMYNGRASKGEKHRPRMHPATPFSPVDSAFNCCICFWHVLQPNLRFTSLLQPKQTYSAFSVWNSVMQGTGPLVAASDFFGQPQERTSTPGSRCGGSSAFFLCCHSCAESQLAISSLTRESQWCCVCDAFLRRLSLGLLTWVFVFFRLRRTGPVSCETCICC